MSKNPKGPVWENKIYSKRPTNTGGNAIIELKKIIIVFFPVKFVDDKTPAMGKPKKHEKVRAKSDTFNESQMISYKLGSNEKTKFNDSKSTST